MPHNYLEVASTDWSATTIVTTTSQSAVRPRPTAPEPPLGDDGIGTAEHPVTIVTMVTTRKPTVVGWTKNKDPHLLLFFSDKEVIYRHHRHQRHIDHLRRNVVQ
jgi:hypothetical protein